MLPADSKARKDVPIVTGVMDYFPLAIAAVARLSKAGNDKHNPGEPLHWSREKSTDHADCIGRHLLERGRIDPETGELHEVSVAWRALAQCQVAEERRLMKPDPVGIAWAEPPSAVNTAPAPEPTKFWYLATPYSKYPGGHKAAFELSARVAAELLGAGVPVFAPIAHSHPISEHLTVSNTDHDFWARVDAHSHPISEHLTVSNTDHDFWVRVDAPFVKLATGLIVYMADGWDESRGVRHEIDTFRAANKPVVFWAPGTFPPTEVM